MHSSPNYYLRAHCFAETAALNISLIAGYAAIAADCHWLALSFLLYVSLMLLTVTIRDRSTGDSATKQFRLVPEA